VVPSELRPVFIAPLSIQIRRASVQKKFGGRVGRRNVLAIKPNRDFRSLFDALAAMSETAHLVQMFDSTVVRAHVSAAGAKGGKDGHALGRSRGGFSTKIHRKADLDGRPLAVHLTEGQAGDSPHFESLLDLGPDITPRAA